MIEISIYAVTAINIFTAALLMPRYMKRSTIYQAAFVLGWTMHYVIGNVLVLLSQNLTYTLASFDEFSEAYLVSLIVGQYFLWIYLLLFETLRNPFVGAKKFRANAYPILLLILAATALFGALFIYQIGLDAFFSRELAQNRNRINDYAGVSIGVYYYLATFLISAAILLGGYAIDYPRFRNLLLTLISIVLVTIVFAPLGGRGRVFNVVIVLVLASLLSQRNERLMSALKLRTVLLASALVAVAVIWGTVRELQTGYEARFGSESVIASLAIDTTRLPNQALIFDQFPATGSYFGLHYVEALLGPFWEMVSDRSVGLIRDYSSLWYGITVGNADQPSAVSPSFIGEIYLNFGVVGVFLSPLILLFIIMFTRRVAGSDHPISTAIILYFFQFGIFHGGLYTLFDLLVLVAPIFFAINVLTSRLAPGQTGAQPPSSLRESAR